MADDFDLPGDPRLDSLFDVLQPTNIEKLDWVFSEDYAKKVPPGKRGGEPPKSPPMTPGQPPEPPDDAPTLETFTGKATGEQGTVEGNIGSALGDDSRLAFLNGKMIPVQSSNVAAMLYVPEKEILYVAFDGGWGGKVKGVRFDVYEYPIVSFEMAEDLAMAKSKGKWVHKYLRETGHPYRRTIVPVESTEQIYHENMDDLPLPEGRLHGPMKGGTPPLTGGKIDPNDPLADILK